jgi:hypothetical protein
VDDAPAREFALTLYANLLGLIRADAREGCYEPTDPQPIYAAMREAWLAIAESLGDARTWGRTSTTAAPIFGSSTRQPCRGGTWTCPIRHGPTTRTKRRKHRESGDRSSGFQRKQGDGGS